jgi:hypothetical protein
VVAAEGSHVDSTQYERDAGTVIVWRGEAQLVARYRQTIQYPAKRLRLDVGWTELYRVKEADLTEAKVSARHRYVREALGQLLDYAAHCTQPVNRLTALFPNAAAPSDIHPASACVRHRLPAFPLCWAGVDNKFPASKHPQKRGWRIATAWSSLARS